MSTPKQQERLTRLGHLLIDLSTVHAVTPLLADTPDDVFGFVLVTTGGSLEVRDAESIEAVQKHFYTETSPS